MYVLMLIFCSLWAGHVWGLWGFLITAASFVIVPVAIVILTMAYMDRNEIDRYKLNFFFLTFDINRKDWNKS